MNAKYLDKALRAIFIFVFVVGAASMPAGNVTAQVSGSDILYTTDADFDKGTLLSVNHDAPNNNQLQLDSQTKPFPFINVAASGRGTVVRTNTETGVIVGEYRTAPEGRGLNPSRTTVDLFGNVWTANRDEFGQINGVPHGSAVKIGLIVGGRRVNADGSANPDGGYLAPPFGYNTCVDRNSDGLIRTSKGLGDILDWPDVTDGLGGADGIVQDAVDECITIYQRLPDAEQARHVSVDADNNVWVGGYPFMQRMFYKLNGTSGAILDSFDTRNIGCGGYGGLVDGNGILWSVGGALLRYDPVARTGFCIQQYGYGLGIDTNGYIWMSLWDGGIVKIAPDGTVVPGFPKPTFPSSMTTALSTTEMNGSMKALPDKEAKTQPNTAPFFPRAGEDFNAPSPSSKHNAPSMKEPALSAFDMDRMMTASPQNDAQTRNGPLAGDPSVTFQVAPVDEWVQSSSPWTPGATITLTIENGGSVVYSASQPADASGNFNFNLWNTFDIQRGQVVTVSDGTTTKTHTVMNLYADGVNIAADTVFGRADAGTDVHIWVHGNGGLNVTADGSGNWVADFSGTTDLTYLSDGGSSQTDEDGDSTGVWWASPRIQVAPEDDWVQSWRPWTPGTMITLTIQEGGVVVYSDSQVADSEGRFNFNFGGAFDLQRGQVVTVSDGTTTKVHTVMPLFVDTINLTTDTISGRADASASVDVWVHGDGNLTVTPDGSGNWAADFSSQTDLTYANDGGSQQFDDDGDSTGVWWGYPSFRVSPDGDWVESRQPWTSGGTITLTIEDGGSVVYSDTQTADIHGNFGFYFGGVFDLQRGQVVTVSDGNYTKTHTVKNLYVDTINLLADTVSGRADAGSSVAVWTGDGSDYQAVTADGSGNWIADFSGMTDITYLSDIYARQGDEDGDVTRIDRSTPRIQVSPDDDWVQSWNRWTPGVTITLTIEQGGVVVYSDSQVSDVYGNFNFNFGGIFDLQRGQVVTVSDGTTTKTHTVMPLYADGVNVTTDTVLGRAAAGTNVEVWVHGVDGNLTVTADGSGHWTADFSALTDLTYTNDGGSQQFDDDGDSTGDWWSTPRFWAIPEDNWVGSMKPWTAGATITLTIEDGGAVVYTDSQVTDSNGDFHFNLWQAGFTLKRGQVVTVSDGTTTKTHTVRPLFVDAVNIANDTIYGRADSGTTVDVWVNGNGNLNVATDGSGGWVADFSGQTDITYANDGGSAQYDDDGDGTGVWWSGPRFWAAPEDDWVGSMRPWTVGATITLTIEDGGVVVYSDSQVADSSGNFNFNFGGVFDLQRGQVVTVSDGTNTKTHTVLPLYVDGVNVTDDTISGRANPGTTLDVWVHGNGSLNVTADGLGHWVADFSSQTDLTYANDGGSGQYDDDGDGTGVWWSSPRIEVSPEDDWVQSWSRWTPGATITLTIKDGGVVVYTDLQVVDSSGRFSFNLWNVFDLKRGQVVIVSDGTTTKTHTVMPLYVDGVNISTETIYGRADAGTNVEVWVHGVNGSINVIADGSGHWAADFSSRADLTYLSDGGSRQVDDDGDSTGVWWSSPNFHVAPDDNWVQQINRWTPGTNITLTIEDGGVQVYSDSQVTDSYGNFNFNVSGAVNMQTGFVVTVSDGKTTKTHTITNPTVTDIDTAADQIHGSANPGARLWVWIYLFNDGSGRSVTAGPDGNWVADFSVGADGQPAYNITDATRIDVDEFDDDGDATYRRFGPPSLGSTGVAVTPLDNNVWIANRNPGTVTRLDNDGNFLAAIPTGNTPTGVAVDAAGKVWATNLGSDNTVRIDPNDGLGAVDLTVDLGPGASPYNYSDMTGAVVVGSTSPQGIWTVIQDSGKVGFKWGRITWNKEPEGSEPSGTAIIVEARSADTEAGLGGQTFQPIVNGEFFSMLGRYIEVRVTLKASPQGDSPVLSDIRIQPHIIYADIDIKPGSYPNTINCKDKTETVTVAVLTTKDFNALTVDYRTVTFEGAKEIHVDKRSGLPVRHIEDVGLDGDMDLVFHFYRRNTSLTCQSIFGQLKGLTYDGIPIEGVDSVRMIIR